MTDSMTEEQALRKALNRERARRRKAEMLLEEKSRALFESFEELEKTYATLKANQKQLVQSEKMASLGIMSAGVAHEINTPVGFALSNMHSLQENMPVLGDAIRTSREFLKLASSAEPALAEAAEKIEADMVEAGVDYVLEDVPDLLAETSEGLIRIKDVVSGLKSFAKEDKSQQEFLNLNQVVHSALGIVRGHLPNTLEITECYGELPAVNGSKAGLSQVVLNMLSNAGDAILDAGQMDGRISITTCVKASEVCLAIADNGCGISAEHLDMLFTPFYTTKDVGRGTGLGLSTSIGVIEALGGRINVASEVGVGTTFEVLLPLRA